MVGRLGKTIDEKDQRRTPEDNKVDHQGLFCVESLMLPSRQIMPEIASRLAMTPNLDLFGK